MQTQPLITALHGSPNDLKNQITLREQKLKNTYGIEQHHIVAEIGLLTRRLQQKIAASVSNYFIVPGLHGLMP